MLGIIAQGNNTFSVQEGIASVSVLRCLEPYVQIPAADGRLSFSLGNFLQVMNQSSA
jgi:hypothetical protein